MQGTNLMTFLVQKPSTTKKLAIETSMKGGIFFVVTEKHEFEHLSNSKWENFSAFSDHPDSCTSNGMEIFFKKTRLYKLKSFGCHLHEGIYACNSEKKQFESRYQYQKHILDSWDYQNSKPWVQIHHFGTNFPSEK